MGQVLVFFLSYIIGSNDLRWPSQQLCNGIGEPIGKQSGSKNVIIVLFGVYEGVKNDTGSMWPLLLLKLCNFE